LDNWLSDSRLKGRTAIHPGESEGKYLVEHYFGESKDIIIDNICSIKIVSYPDINVDIVTKSTIHNHIFAKITSSGQKTVDEYIILKNIFQDFLNFVINDVVKTLRLVGNAKIKIDDHHITEHVEIFYRSSISKTMDKLNVKSPYLLNYQNIAKRFSEILNRWFDLKNKIPSAYDLYFGVMYNSDLYLSNKFLMLTEAIEIYMNYVSKQKLDPDLTDKIARIDHICKAIDECTLNETDREWVKTILKDKKSLSFKENLRKVFDICQELFPILSSVIGSKQEFSSKIKEYRNRLTHADIDYNQLDNDELSRKCKDLQLVLQLCILSELGFSSSEIKDIYLIPTTAK
jgi:HEPN superfamily Apea-like protein